MGNYNYKRLNLAERNAIEQELQKKTSARRIAAMLERSVSSITDEVKRNRVVRSWTNKGQKVVKLPDKNICPKIQGWPYVCNGCTKIGQGCGYGFKTEYRAVVANKFATKTRSQSREGINCTQEEFEKLAYKINSDIAEKKLSPYQCSVSMKEESVSSSTIYRWIDLGYAGLSNLDLRKKVKYKPRSKKLERKTTSHGIQYSYAAFCKLSQDERDSAVEMDTVIGRKYDTKCILTLFFRTCKFQLFLLMNSKTLEQCKKQLDHLENICGKDFFELLLGLILTDNGVEFADPELLSRSCLAGNKYRLHIYYCDVRASDQKGGCEKNHVELRKIIPKEEGIVFDDLDNWDMAVLMSQVNSQPRKSLGGKSPIQVFKSLYGGAGIDFLDSLGVEELKTDELQLSLKAINDARTNRGLSKIKIDERYKKN